MAREAYHAYLMRLWLVENDRKAWRVRLENVETGEVLGFPSLEMLMMYLQSLDFEAGNPPAREGVEAEDVA